MKLKISGQDHLAVCTWVLNSGTSVIRRARTGVGGHRRQTCRQRSRNPGLSEAGSSERMFFLVLGENEVPLVSSPQISGLRRMTEFAMLFWRCSTWCNQLHAHETNIEQKVLININTYGGKMLFLFSRPGGGARGVDMSIDVEEVWAWIGEVPGNSIRDNPRTQGKGVKLTETHYLVEPLLGRPQTGALLLTYSSGLKQDPARGLETATPHSVSSGPVNTHDFCI